MSRFYGVKAPHCPPEEANRLRDLWRPGVQEDSVPLIRSGTFGDGEHEFRMIPRPDDYDPTQTSLWAHNPMYVIPPEIAEPLSERLDRHHDEPFFEEHRDWGAGVTHGAKRF